MSNTDFWLSKPRYQGIKCGFCDGGQIGSNAQRTDIGLIAIALSSAPGIYDYSAVRDLRPWHMHSNEITTEQHRGVITNNQAEWMAMLWLLHAMPTGWSGTVVCDSQVTIRRWFTHRLRGNNDGIPPRWLSVGRRELRRLGKIKVVHVDGHMEESDHWSHKGNCLCDKSLGQLKLILGKQMEQGLYPKMHETWELMRIP